MEHEKNSNKEIKPARTWGGASAGGERGCLPGAVWETGLSSQERAMGF